MHTTHDSLHQLAPPQEYESSSLKHYYSSTGMGSAHECQIIYLF
jgi:hypothetical protein